MNFLDMGFLEIILILMVALLIFGPGSVPKVAKQLGSWVRAFRKITSDMAKDFTKALDAEEKSGSASNNVSKQQMSKPLDDVTKPGAIKDMAKDAVKKKAQKSLDKYLGLEDSDDFAG